MFNPQYGFRRYPHDIGIGAGMSGLLELIVRVPDLLSLSVALGATIFALIGAFLTLQRAREEAGGQGKVAEKDLERIKIEIAGARAGDPIPFEIEQLANYYSVTLGQAKISFWFSLIFASIGFVVILGAALLYKEGDVMGASIKITSGLVIDAVAALFFVQSRRAQEAMGSFFEKLRTDRQFIEARKICDEISNDTTKDSIKTILVLHYSGLQTTGMLDVLAGVKPLNHTSASNGHAREPAGLSRGSARKPKPTASAPSGDDGTIQHEQ